jgi:citrate/tricarballylate utilization protein
VAERPVAVPIEIRAPGTSLEDLVAEASRQLSICNACRYCEGLCAVFPAVERRDLLGSGDVTQIANLCHDCRACFDACMYASPHEFKLDLPVALSAVRVADYRRLVWPHRVPGLLRGRIGLLIGVVVSSLVFLATALIDSGPARLLAAGPGSDAQSPYELISYPVLLVLVLLPAVYAAGVLLGAARTYWREVGASEVPVGARAVGRAVWEAATLRYLRGGGVDCPYPDDTTPSGARRHLHGLVAYGFGLCLISTISAGVLQDLMGQDPPYGWLSVPVLTGTVGGLGLAVGCIWLLVLKRRSSPQTSFAAMTVKDYGLLVALAFLAVTGLVVLLLRTTPAYGIVLLVHLAAVALSFAMAPYSKLAHVVYRFLALVRDNAERLHR